MARAGDLTQQLTEFGRRPAGSEAERLSAKWASKQITADPKRRAEVQTFWSRPNWVGAQAWHIILAVIGSLLATTEARPGAGVIFAALVFMLSDWLFGLSPGRFLTRERASQNVVSISPREPRVRLILTANLDTGRNPDTRRLWLPGWVFWIFLLTVWCLAVALARIDSGKGHVLIAVLQIIPTIGLIMAFSWLLVGAQPTDNAGGVGAALGLLRILDAAPPQNLGVDLILSGAGMGYGTGLRRYLRTHAEERDVTNTVILGFTGAADVPITYLVSDGALLPLLFFAPLRKLAEDSGLFTATTGRGCSPALPGRMRRLPALSVSGDPDALVTAGLELVDAVDAYVGGLVQQTSRNRSDRGDRVVLGRPLANLVGRKSKA